MTKKSMAIKKLASDMDYAGEAILYLDPSKMRLVDETGLLSFKVEGGWAMKRKGMEKVEFIGPEPGWSWYGHLNTSTGIVRARKYPMPPWARKMPGYR